MEYKMEYKKSHVPWLTTEYMYLVLLRNGHGGSEIKAVVFGLKPVRVTCRDFTELSCCTLLLFVVLLLRV